MNLAKGTIPITLAAVLLTGAAAGGASYITTQSRAEQAEHMAADLSVRVGAAEREAAVARTERNHLRESLQAHAARVSEDVEAIQADIRALTKALVDETGRARRR